MRSTETLSVFIGHDSREAVASDVCAHSILRRTEEDVEIHFLKHRDLRQRGVFVRPWIVDADTGNWRDLIDNRPFSTEFSHTRFLVPALMNYKGWALFMDSDMIFLTDIKKLFALADPKFAVMVYKHQHRVEGEKMKMDGRKQSGYHRKNWSSFILFNCSHPSNRALTPEKVNTSTGADLHSFFWLRDHEIGDLPNGYNFIPGVSPLLPLERGNRPDVLHFTEGGPWFEECQEVPYGQFWLDEYESYQREGAGSICGVPTTKYDDTEEAQ